MMAGLLLPCLVALYALLPGASALEVLRYEPHPDSWPIPFVHYDLTSSTLYAWVLQPNESAISWLFSWHGIPSQPLEAGPSYNMSSCMMQGYGGFSWIGASLWVGCQDSYEGIFAQVWSSTTKSVVKTYRGARYDFNAPGFAGFVPSLAGDGSVYASCNSDTGPDSLVHINADLTNYTTVSVDGAALYYGVAASDGRYLYVAYGEMPVWDPVYLLAVDPKTMHAIKNVSLPINGTAMFSAKWMTVDPQKELLYIVGSTYGFSPDAWTGLLVYHLPSLRLVHRVVVCDACFPATAAVLVPGSDSLYFATDNEVYQMNLTTFSVVCSASVNGNWTIQSLTYAGQVGGTHYLMAGAQVVTGHWLTGGLIFFSA